jgi:hypothetical protein
MRTENPIGLPNLIGSGGQKVQDIPAKKQNARQEFPPGIKVQAEKFFSWLRPCVKNENVSLGVEGRSDATSASRHEIHSGPRGPFEGNCRAVGRT